MDVDEEAEWYQRRLEALATAYGGNAPLGKALGYKSGAFVGHMIKGLRPILPKTIRKAESLPGRQGWFKTDAKLDEATDSELRLALLAVARAIDESGTFARRWRKVSRLFASLAEESIDFVTFSREIGPLLENIVIQTSRGHNRAGQPAEVVGVLKKVQPQDDSKRDPTEEEGGKGAQG